MLQRGSGGLGAYTHTWTLPEPTASDAGEELSQFSGAPGDAGEAPGLRTTILKIQIKGTRKQGGFSIRKVAAGDRQTRRMPEHSFCSPH